MNYINGENLNGWTVKLTHHELGENYAHTFRVENGNLINRYDVYETFGTQFGHIYYEKPFSYYRLIAEYRLRVSTSRMAPRTLLVPLLQARAGRSLYIVKK